MVSRCRLPGGVFDGLRSKRYWTAIVIAASLAGCATSGPYDNRQGPKNDPVEIAWPLDTEHSNDARIDRFPLGLDRFSYMFSAAILLKSMSDSRQLDGLMKKDATFEPLDRYFLNELAGMLSRRNMPVSLIDVPIRDGIPDYRSLPAGHADWVFHIKRFETRYSSDGLLGKYFPECSVVVVPYRKSTKEVFDPITVDVVFNQPEIYGFGSMDDLKAVPDLGLKGLKQAIRTAANSVMTAIRH